MNSEHNESHSFSFKKIIVPISLLGLILFLVNYVQDDTNNEVVQTQEAITTQNPNQKIVLNSNRRVASSPRQRVPITSSPQSALNQRAQKTYARINKDPVPQEDFLYDEEEKTREQENQRDAKDKNSLNPEAASTAPVIDPTQKKETHENKLPESIPTLTENETSNTTSDSSQEIAQSFVGNNNQSEESNSDSSESETEKSDSVVNQAPTISADKTSLAIEEEKTDTIKVTGTDPENIYIDFTPVGLPAFITTSRSGNEFTLNINPLYGDSGTYNFQVIASDDQGLAKAIDLEVVVSKYVYVVKKLQLVNSTTDTILGDLTDGQTIDLDVVGDQLNIVADVPFAASVKFDSSDAYTNTEDVLPFAYKDDTAGDYHDWTPTLGPLTITVTPYELTGATGTAGTPYVINLNFIDSNP